MSNFSELSRVQAPAMMHLLRLGYTYFGKISEEDAGRVYDPDTNILLDVFRQQFDRLNPDHKGEAQRTLSDLRLLLSNDDLGASFYKALTGAAPRLIDFDNPERNTFHFTAEFTCRNGDDNFRPDITLFVNGLPLCFVEVKKPNNSGGMIAEARRMNLQRFPNKKYRRFINITQLMIFSNNMEYDTLGGTALLQGAFYCTAARSEARFNCFREENPHDLDTAPYHSAYPYLRIDPEVERRILHDFNSDVIHTSPEYQTNIATTTPTNRILTSMCSPERLLFLLRYGIAYVRSEREIDGHIEFTDEKHIMRYQQMFAALAIRQKLSEGQRAGVVWHTQGSGKTALSYHLVHVLTDYYAHLPEPTVAKFYFIVDRIDLLEQASQEFTARGLVVQTAQTRDELMRQFRDNAAQQGDTGQTEITVVNIQRFAEDRHKVELPAYATRLQRIFIMDEAHRGYRPGGSFLANLFEADTASIKIALTGTPLLKAERASAKIFNDYFHTYYYDRSIADGYTLKIMREDIETSYKERINEVYDNVSALVEKKDVKRSTIIEHPNYVRELLRYIIDDLNAFRIKQGDATLAGMIVCETSEQARQLAAHFDSVQDELNATRSLRSTLRYGLILHDSEDKETRAQIVKDYKKNMTIDVLIVFNMLLTGFDAPRLKRLYFGRKLKDHNLLQALTRVNRPYKNMRYGFIIDFADIKENFDQTNEAYLQELNRYNNPDEIGKDLPSTLTSVLVDPQQVIEQMEKVQDILFDYTTNNAEEFSKEISTQTDKQQLLDLKKALETARDCANIVRTFGDDNLKQQFQSLQLPKVPEMLSEVQHCINVINQKQALYDYDATSVMINDAMQDITFTFSCIGKEELNIISGGQELKEKWNRTIHAFTSDIDPDDPEYMTLRDALTERCREHGFVIDSLAKYNEEKAILDDIIKRLQTLQQHNHTLMGKYNGDAKFVRIHKRICEEDDKREKKGEPKMFGLNPREICTVLNTIKANIDQKVYDKNDILKKDAYFEQTVMQEIMYTFYHIDNLSTHARPDDYDFVKKGIARQYLAQYRDTYPQ